MDPCLETTYTEPDSQAARPPFQELQFNDPQQAFQVCSCPSTLLQGRVKLLRVVGKAGHKDLANAYKGTLSHRVNCHGNDLGLIDQFSKAPLSQGIDTAGGALKHLHHAT